MINSKFQIAHMETAEVYAKLSSAKRLKVGCVIVKSDTIIGIGYNGMPAGWDNNCENTIGYSKGEPVLKTRPEVLHAETNAITKVARSTNSTEGASMFVTHAPCIECAKLIHQSGINSVYYRENYRNEDGLDFLNQCGIIVTNLKEK